MSFLSVINGFLPLIGGAAGVAIIAKGWGLWQQYRRDKIQQAILNEIKHLRNDLKVKTHHGREAS